MHLIAHTKFELTLEPSTVYLNLENVLRSGSFETRLQIEPRARLSGSFIKSKFKLFVYPSLRQLGLLHLVSATRFELLNGSYH